MPTTIKAKLPLQTPEQICDNVLIGCNMSFRSWMAPVCLASHEIDSSGGSRLSASLLCSI